MSPGEVDQNSCDACLSITEILNKCPEYTVFGVCYPSKLCDALVRYRSETTQELKFAKLPFDDMSMNVLATDASACLPNWRLELTQNNKKNIWYRRWKNKQVIVKMVKHTTRPTDFDKSFSKLKKTFEYLSQLGKFLLARKEIHS